MTTTTVATQTTMATATTTTRRRIGTHLNKVSTRGDFRGTSTSPDGLKGTSGSNTMQETRI